MGEAVQESGGHLGALEDLGPLGEGQVGGDDDRGLLVEFGGQVEDQLASVFRKGQVPQLVHDDQVHASQAGGQPSALALHQFAFQVVGQVHQVVEARPVAGLYRLHGYGDGQVGLARAGAAHHDEVAPLPDEISQVEMPDHLLVDGTAFKLEAVQVLSHGESGLGQSVADGSQVSICLLAFQEFQDNSFRPPAVFQTQGQQFGISRAHAAQPQPGHGLQDTAETHLSLFSLRSAMPCYYHQSSVVGPDRRRWDGRGRESHSLFHGDLWANLEDLWACE